MKFSIIYLKLTLDLKKQIVEKQLIQREINKVEYFYLSQCFHLKKHIT